MAVNLINLVDSLKREVNPPGTDLFPDATDDAFFGSLTDAFWEVRLYGLLSGFEEDVAARGGDVSFGEGIVTPIGAKVGYDAPSGYAATDLSRELQQMIVLWGGWKIVLARLTNLNTVFHAIAGPVQIEIQQSASVLKGVLDALRERIEFLLKYLSRFGGSSVAVFDGIIDRTYATALHENWWIR